MKKLNKVAMLFASVALAAPMATSAQSGTPTGADNWRNGDGTMVWKNGTNELCWRDGFWTPATANAACDGALKPPPPPPPPPPPAAAPAAGRCRPAAAARRRPRRPRRR